MNLSDFGASLHFFPRMQLSGNLTFVDGWSLKFVTDQVVITFGDCLSFFFLPGNRRAFLSYINILTAVGWIDAEIQAPSRINTFKALILSYMTRKTAGLFPLI